jgi:hypothetical protein
VKSIVVQRKMSEKKKREKEGGLFRRVNGTWWRLSNWKKEKKNSDIEINQNFSH